MTIEKRIKGLKLNLLVLPIGAILALLPFFGTEYFTSVLTFSSIYAIMVMAFDLFWGYIGELNFGYAVFVGIGTYTAALFSGFLGISTIFAIPVAGAVGLLLGLGIGLVFLRLKGPYFAMVTFGVGMSIQMVFAKAYEITRGDEGIHIVPFSYQPLINYYITLATLILTAIVVYSVAKSDIGLIFKSIKDDELASASVGHNTLKYKVLAFALSAFFGGVAGTMRASFIGLSEPGAFASTITLDLVVMAVLGGVGTTIGPLLAAFVIVPLNEYLRFLQEYRYLVYCAVLLLVLRFASKGLYGYLQRIVNSFSTWLKK